MDKSALTRYIVHCVCRKHRLPMAWSIWCLDISIRGWHINTDNTTCWGQSEKYLLANQTLTPNLFSGLSFIVTKEQMRVVTIARLTTLRPGSCKEVGLEDPGRSRIRNLWW